MKRLVLVPDGWPCKRNECRAGLFVTLSDCSDFWSNGAIGLNTDYNTAYLHNGDSCCYEGYVQPVIPEWEEYEE